MEKVGKILAVLGVLLVVGAVIWHFASGSALGNPLIPKTSSPSNVATFGNSLMLIAMLIILRCCKKD